MTTPQVSLPDWTWDETVLAYELYLRDYADPIKYPDGTHSAVRSLSVELRNLPQHPSDIRANPRFRNSDGVARKIQNLMYAATGRYGSPHGSAMDRRVVATLTDQDDTRRIAAALRIAATEVPTTPVEDEDEQDGEEGGLLYRWHVARERDRKLAARKKKEATDSGQPILCEGCGLDVSAKYGTQVGAVIECHHRLPLSAGKRTTRLVDLALVCPTCHRVLHFSKQWLSVDELRQRLGR